MFQHRSAASEHGLSQDFSASWPTFWRVESLVTVSSENKLSVAFSVEACTCVPRAVFLPVYHRVLLSSSVVQTAMEEEVLLIYPPTWFVKYDLLTKERVPFCGPQESHSGLSRLYDQDKAFFRALVVDKDLRQCFLQRGKGGHDESFRQRCHKIEEALMNRATFACRQMSRVVACEPYITDEEEKARVAHDAYMELMQSMTLL
jgi:hypothetical protein